MSKINLPVKCGEMYIKFENRKPVYGFKMCGHNQRTIEKFINLQDTLPKTIVLPLIQDQDIEIPEPSETNLTTPYHFGSYEPYVSGNIRLTPTSFQGIKNTTIIVPGTASVRLDYPVFDDYANNRFILPEGMGLTEISRSVYNGQGLGFNTISWTLIAKENLKVNMGTALDHFRSEPCDTKTDIYRRFTINPYYQVINGKIVEKVKTSEDECEM